MSDLHVKFLTLLLNPEKCVDESYWVDTFKDNTNTLKEILSNCDSGTLEYKRFSYIISSYYNLANPELMTPVFANLNPIIKIKNAGRSDTSGHSPRPQHFHVGENLASTDGFIIFENEYLQLIFYPSQLQHSYSHAVFIVTPWINKYYIFDLSPENSYIRWLLNKGISVYCISWVNPDRTYSEQGLFD